jgi:hypothetical protein
MPFPQTAVVVGDEAVVPLDVSPESVEPAFFPF